MKPMKTKIFLIVLTVIVLASCDKDDAPTIEPFVDLKAEAITYQMVSQTSATTGQVRITGHIKNVGNANFSSSLGQQVAYLSERPLGTTTETIMASANLPAVINAGDEVTFSYVKNWDTTIEFQNDVILRVSYDPDILVDGNANNDDTNSTNNVMTLAGNMINSLF